MNKEIDLTIKDLSPKDDKVIEIHPNIPSLPLNLIVIGRSGCGKTNMLLNLIGFYGKTFKNKIIVFSKTNDSSLKYLKDNYNAKVFLSIGNKIESIMEIQKQQKDQGKRPEPICLIFDDYITDGLFNKRRSIFDKLFSMGRHPNISIIITSQSYTLLPATIRRMAWNIILFKISNKGERKIIIDELSTTLDLTENQFEEIYDNATEQKYSFLYINVLKQRYLTRFGV